MYFTDSPRTKMETVSEAQTHQRPGKAVEPTEGLFFFPSREVVSDVLRGG